MTVSTYVTEGIILVRKPYRESSIFCKCLTENHGLITVIAAGSNKENSKFHGILEPFNYVNLELYKSSKSDIFNLRNAISIQSFAHNIDYGSTMLLSAAGELLLQLNITDEESNQYFRLMTDYCLYLKKTTRNPVLVYIRFVLRLFSILGIYIKPVCTLCGNNKISRYSHSNHGFICDKCIRSERSGRDNIPVLYNRQQGLPSDNSTGENESDVCLSAETASIFENINNLDQVDESLITEASIHETVTFFLSHLTASFHKRFKLNSLKDYPLIAVIKASELR